LKSVDASAEFVSAFSKPTSKPFGGACEVTPWEFESPVRLHTSSRPFRQITYEADVSMHAEIKYSANDLIPIVVPKHTWVDLICV